MRKGQQGRHNRDRHGKRGVTRHQMQCKASADSQSRAIETTERQGAAREIELELDDLDQE